MHVGHWGTRLIEASFVRLPAGFKMLWGRSPGPGHGGVSPDLWMRRSLPGLCWLRTLISPDLGPFPQVPVRTRTWAKLGRLAGGDGGAAGLEASHRNPKRRTGHVVQ